MSPRDVLIGIDVGTTRCKALITSTAGEPLASGESPTRWDRPAEQQREQAEMPAERMVHGALTALSHAVEAAESRAPVRALGIGIAGMAEAGVLIGPDRRPRAPVIAWFDGRGQAQAARLSSLAGEGFTVATGLPPSPLCSLVKIAWMREHLGVRLDDACWLNVPEYLAFALSGDRAAPAAEPSLAARTGLLDLQTRSAWTGASELLGRSRLLPTLLDAGRSFGTVAADGVPPALRGAVVTVAGHDHPVAAIGAGATGTDDLFDSCGTAQALVRSTGVLPAVHTRLELAAGGLNTGLHPIAGQYMVLGGTRGGLLLRRVLALLGVSTFAAELDLDQRALPWLERESDIELSGGMGVETSGVTVRVTGDDLGPEQLWAAALQHAGRIGQDKIRAVEAAVGPHSRVVCAGGWIRVEGYRRVKRRLLPDVVFSTEEEPGGRGAAMLAAVAARGEDPARGVRAGFG